MKDELIREENNKNIDNLMGLDYTLDYEDDYEDDGLDDQLIIL